MFPPVALGPKAFQLRGSVSKGPVDKGTERVQTAALYMGM